MIFLIIQAKLAAHTLDATTWIKSAPRYDGVAAYNCLKDLIFRDSSQSKTVAILGFASCKQGPKEKVDSYISRYARAWLKVEKTGATLEDVRTGFPQQNLRRLELAIHAVNVVTLLASVLRRSLILIQALERKTNLL